MSRKPASLIGRGKEVAILNREAKFTVKFWGVRGSIPCPGLAYHRYGGNTPCVEMTCGDKTLIFDAGTGLRSLGQELVKKGKIEAEIFFSTLIWTILLAFHFSHLRSIQKISSKFGPLFLISKYQLRKFSKNLLLRQCSRFPSKYLMHSSIF